MRLSKNLFVDVLDELNEIVYIQDINWKVLYANRMALEVFGYRRDEVEGIDLRNLLDEENFRLAAERLKEMLKSKKPPQKPAEYLVKAKDGRRIWIELRTKPIIQDGEVVAILGIARDITERKLLEEKLRESEEKLKVIFENSPNIIVIVDKSGKVVEANPACYKSMGINPIGKNLYELFPKEIAENRMKLLRKVLDTGKMVVVQGEDRGRYFVTSLIPIELHGRRHCLVIAQDVTDLLRVNKLLETIKDINKLMIYEKHKENLISKAEEKINALNHVCCWVGLVENGGIILPSVRVKPEKGRDVDCLVEALDTKKSIIRVGEMLECRKCRFFSQHRTLFRYAIPMLVNGEVKGGVVLQSKVKLSEGEFDLFRTLTADLAFAIRAIELYELERRAYEQLNKNIEHFAILVDRIRNPLAAAKAFTEIYVEDEEVRRKINEQHERILDLVRQLEKAWEESESLKRFLEYYRGSQRL